MAKTIIKHWAGLLDFKNMCSNEWLCHWILKAKKSAENNKSLIIFEIPNKNGQLDGVLLEEIELFIQSKTN
jgi:hypothetical protein